MKIVFINHRKGINKILGLPTWAKALCSLCLLGVPLSTGLFLGLQLSGGKIGFLVDGSYDQQQNRGDRQMVPGEGKSEAEQQLEAMSLRLAELKARLVRLDALGERLTEIADLEDGEFDFSHEPPMGGPEGPEYPAIGEAGNPYRLMEELENQIKDRQQQLGVLESIMLERQQAQKNAIGGRPVESGWISSPFGMRSDPFTGRRTWHNGIDFAGSEGDAVLAVGSGVVIWSGKYQGYGNMIEIDHGNGLITRYGHNQVNFVQVGDLIDRGDIIANMGSTGRSTGPHVHLEVYKHGRAVDPASYIRQNLR